MYPASGKLAGGAGMTGFEPALIIAGHDPVGHIYRGGRVVLGPDVMGGKAHRDMAVDTIGCIFYPVFYLAK